MAQKATLVSDRLKSAPADEALPFRQAPHNLEAEQALLGAILVNNEAMDRVSGFLEPHHFFDPLHQQIFETAAAQAHVDMQANYDVKNPQALKELYAGGTKLHAFPRDMMNAAFRASMDYYEELSAKNPNWKKVYADYNTFRRDQNLWFRFAEAGFDEFMQSQKL